MSVYTSLGPETKATDDDYPRGERDVVIDVATAYNFGVDTIRVCLWSEPDDAPDAMEVYLGLTREQARALAAKLVEAADM